MVFLKKKPIKLIFFIFFIIITYNFYNQIINSIDFLIWYIYDSENEVIQYIITTGTVISVFLFAKKYLWDTRQLINLQKELGKKGLYDSLSVLHTLIKVYGNKETVKRIKLIDETEYKMKYSIKILSNTIQKKEESKPIFKLGLKDKFILSKKILERIRLIDKQMDINKIEDNINVSNRRNKRRKPIIDKHTEETKKVLYTEFKKK